MKTKLVVEIDFDFLLLAICCHQMDYRLCWALNNNMKFSLKKQKDYILKIYQDKESSFSYYKYYDEVKNINYNIVANKGSHALLAKEYPSVDYFMIIDGYHESIDQDLFLEKVKSIPMIITAFYLDPNSLHSKMNFVFE